MTSLSRLIFLLSLVFSSLLAFSQAAGDDPDRVYGFDPLLYNGRLYTFFPQPGTGGTQFLFNKFDTIGSVTLRGVTYSNLTLNYDIYSQQLVLKYYSTMGSASLIEISCAWLEKFELGGCHFKIETETDTTKRIYQVLGDGTEKIKYYRKKELLLYNQPISGIYYFSKVNREMYVLTGNRMIKFKNNRGFVAAFSSSKQELIKKYLRNHNIKVTKANDLSMTELINYCNTLGRL